MHFAAYSFFANEYFFSKEWRQPGPRATFLATKEGIEKFRESDWHKGVRSDGVEFWTTPLGLMIVVDQLPELIAVNEELQYGIPDPDWLMHSLSTQQYMPRVFDMHVFYATHYATKAWAKELAEREEAYQKKLGEILGTWNVPDTPEFRKLAGRLIHFDYAYRYTDDIGDYRRCSQAELEIKQGFKDYPLALKAFSEGFKV